MAQSDITRLIRAGTWTVVRRGVYALTEVWEALPHLAAKQRMIDRAACARISMAFVRSHSTAALELDMGILLPAVSATHITRPRVVGQQCRFGVKHHLAPYSAEMETSANGFAVLGPARTAIDIAREDGYLCGVIAIDSARRMGVTLDQLHAVFDRMQCWPNRRVVARALEASVADSDSVGETLARTVVDELGLGPIETQFGLSDGRRTYFADMRIGRQLYEFDGVLKYLTAAQGGVARMSAEQVVMEEKRRTDFYTGFKLGMSRIMWDDCFGAAKVALQARLRREYADTERRWGSSIDDLAPYIVHRRRRPAA